MIRMKPIPPSTPPKMGPIFEALDEAPEVEPGGVLPVSEERMAEAMVIAVVFDGACCPGRLMDTNDTMLDREGSSGVEVADESAVGAGGKMMVCTSVEDASEKEGPSTSKVIAGTRLGVDENIGGIACGDTFCSNE